MRRTKAVICCGLSLILSLSASCGNGAMSLADQAREDMASYLTGGAVSDSDTAITVNGEGIPASVYFYWVANGIDQLGYFYDEISMEDDINGQTFGEYIKSGAVSNTVYYAAIIQQAESRGIELTSQEQDELDYYLEYQLNPDSLLYTATDLEYQGTLYKTSFYIDSLKELLYTDGGEYEISDEELSEYMGDDEYVTMYYMYFDNGDAGTGDESLAKAQSACDALLSASEEDFDSVFLEYASGSGVYDTRHTFKLGTKDKAVEQAAVAMEPGDIQVLQTEHGAYVIVKCDLDNSYLKTYFADEAFTKLAYQWQDDAEVEIEESIKSLDLTVVYENLLNLREEMDENTGSSTEEAVTGSGTLAEPADPDVDVEIIN